MSNILDSPEGFFALFVGLFILSEIVKAYLRQGTSKLGERAKTKEGVIVMLLFVGVIWIIFAEPISMFFDFINSNGIAIFGMGLIIIGFLIWKSRGVKEV